MKKINKFLTIAFAISIGFFTSCAVDEYADAEREPSPVPSGGSQAFIFEGTATNLSFVPSNDQKFIIKVGRSKTVSETAATINVITEDPDGVFTVPSTVTFAAGATEAEILVTFDFQLGQKSTLTVGFNEADAYIYGKSNVAVSVLRDYVWVSAGVAEMTSAWAGGPVDVPIQFAQNSNPLRYRLESPYYYLEPDYCEVPGYHLVFELDADYNALNFFTQQPIGETYGDYGDIYFFYPDRGDTFTNTGNVFTILGSFRVAAGGLAQMTEKFVWKEEYPGTGVASINYNELAYDEISGAVSEFTSAAYYNKTWNQSFAKAVDESEYENLYYLSDLYYGGYGLAFYYDGTTITIPEDQPTGTSFKQQLYVSQSENIESSVVTTAKGLKIYTLGLNFHYQDGTVVGEFAETFYYSKDPVAYDIADFYGDFKLIGSSQFDDPDAEMEVSIAAGATNNTFVITGIDYAESVEATFDPSTSTMSIAPQELADYGRYDMALYTTTPAGDVSTTATMDFTFNMSGNLAMTATSEGDGYLLRSEAAGGWVDGYYDLTFIPVGEYSALLRHSVSKTPVAQKILKTRSSNTKAEKCSQGNFVIQEKVSPRTMMNSKNFVPVF